MYSSRRGKSVFYQPNSGEIRKRETLVTSVPGTFVPSSVQLFPNPNTGDFRISSGSPIREITIVDSYGRSFYSASFRSTDLQFTLPGIHPGIYLLQLSLDGNVSQVIRLVIG